MLNTIVLIGRLTADPELRYTKSGIAVASFTLAVERKYKDANGDKLTDFIACQCWRGLAENCANYLRKGQLAAVAGALETSRYEAKDGSTRTRFFVNADEVRFLSPKQGGQAADDEQLYGDDMPF